MSSIFGILNTGRQGLIAQQAALSITGNNIANVNTAGYSRQRANLSSINTGGVKLTGIERLRDDFLVARLRETNAQVAGSDSLATNLAHMESLMGDTEDSGIPKSIRDFFSALNDLTLNPSGTTERGSVRSQALQLTSTLGSLANQFQQVRKQLDLQVTQTADRVNSLTSQIDQINQQIGDLGTNAADAQRSDINQMYDERDKLVDELSSIIPIKVIKDQSGAITVFGSNEVLVEGGNQRQLVAVVDEANDGYHTLALQDSSGNVRPLSQPVTDGSLGALLQARDGYGKDALDQINRLSAQLIRDVNVQHRAGVGLDGVSGRDFFQGLSVTAAPGLPHKGGASVSTTAVTDDTALTFDDYEIRFTSGSQFDVVDKTTGSTLSSNNAYTSGGAIDFAGMRVTLADGASGPAAGDVFKVNAYDGTAERMGLSAAVSASVQAIAAGQSTASGDNSNALALAGLRDRATMGNPPSQSFESFFDTARLQLSMAAESAQESKTNEGITQQQISGMADAVSGVSVDDEAINIIQFQRAFEASGRVIKVADELLQSLLNII